MSRPTSFYKKAPITQAPICKYKFPHFTSFNRLKVSLGPTTQFLSSSFLGSYCATCRGKCAMNSTRAQQTCPTSKVLFILTLNGLWILGQIAYHHQTHTSSHMFWAEMESYPASMIMPQPSEICPTNFTSQFTALAEIPINFHFCFFTYFWQPNNRTGYRIYFSDHRRRNLFSIVKIWHNRYGFLCNNTNIRGNRNNCCPLYQNLLQQRTFC